MSSEADAQEDDLWRRACGGDGEALGAIFDRYQHRVYRHALWMLGDVHDAQDAAAVAFFELWRRRRHVRVVNGSVLPWLLATTANVCRNARRANGRYRSLLATLPRSTTVTSAEDTAIERAGLLEGIDPALAEQLRDLHQGTLALFALTAVEGYSVAEAARVVGVREGAAKTRLSRARAMLRTSSASHGDSSRLERGAS